MSEGGSWRTTAAVALWLLALLAVAMTMTTVRVAAHEADETSTTTTTAVKSSRAVKSYDVLPRGHFKVAVGSARRSMDNSKRYQPFGDRFVLDLETLGTTVHFDMEINPNLIHPDIRSNGVVTHKYYRGTASSPLGAGFARLTLHDEDTIEGIFVLNDDLYNIQTVRSFNKLEKTKIAEGVRARNSRSITDEDAHTIVYRAKDVEISGPNDELCGVGMGGFEQHVIADNVPRYYSNEYENVMNELRTNERFAAGCSSTPQALYLGVAADCTYVAQKGSVSAAKDAILDDYNKASGVYETSFDVSLGIIDLTYIMENCGQGINWNVKCSDGYSIQDRLSDMAQWRGGLTDSYLANAGLFHLLSDCATDSIIGIAWLNMLCQTNAISQTVDGQTQYVSGVAVVTVVDSEWLVVAHETGHNFGSNHDCTADACTSGDTTCCKCGSCDCGAQYIMNPSEGAGNDVHGFSQCSIDTICQRSSITGDCFMAPGTLDVLNPGICGNGIWEPPNEECDCGGSQNCSTNACCYSNCTLKPGAECSDSNTKCCSGCQIIHDTSIVCRPAKDQCDVPEFCDGNTALCPTDLFVADHTVCNNSCDPTATDTYCASGVCTSRDLQCKQRAILDPTAEGYDTACSQFEGVCELWCYNSLEGCNFFPGEFRNGTKCGNAGTCVDGQCSDPDLVGKILQFIQEHEVLVIVLGVVVGILLLVLLYFGCQSAGRRKIKKQWTKSMNTMRRMNRNRGANSNNGAARSSSSHADPDLPAYAPPPYTPAGSSAPQTSAQNPNRTSMVGSSGANRSSMVGSSGSGAVAGAPKGEMHDMRQIARCPICQKVFGSEAQVNTHLDIDH